MDPYGGGGYQQQPPYYQQDMAGYGAPPQQQWNAGPQGGDFPGGGPPGDFTPLDFPNYYSTSGPPAYPTSPAWGPPPQGIYNNHY
jgi:hypothetical protein